MAADESVRSLDDARRVIQLQAADDINIKIMKTGVVEALRIAALARSVGLRLMIGGMVETRIAMGCSFSLVLGQGGFDVLDLDTPLLLSTDPVLGGYSYSGPILHPWYGAGTRYADTLSCRLHDNPIIRDCGSRLFALLSAAPCSFPEIFCRFSLF